MQAAYTQNQPAVKNSSPLFEFGNSRSQRGDSSIRRILTRRGRSGLKPRQRRESGIGLRSCHLTEGLRESCAVGIGVAVANKLRFTRRRKQTCQKASSTMSVATSLLVPGQKRCLPAGLDVCLPNRRERCDQGTTTPPHNKDLAATAR